MSYQQRFEERTPKDTLSETMKESIEEEDKEDKTGVSWQLTHSLSICSQFYCVKWIFEEILPLNVLTTFFIFYNYKQDKETW